MDGLSSFFLTGIIIMAFLFWWSDHTRAGRRFIHGDEDEEEEYKKK